MKKKYLLLLLGIVVAAIFFTVFYKKPAAEYFTLKRTDVDYKILASCTVSFPEPYAMAARSEGDVKRIPVAEGQQVSKGALLIQVDDFKERQNLTIALNNYESIKLKLKNVNEEAYPRLKEQFSNDNAVLTDAKNSAERMQKLFDGGAVSRVELENARMKHDLARAKLNQTRLQIDSYASSGAAAELINQLNILNAQVELARRAVGEKQFLAPYDCTVIKLDSKEGETVSAGKKMITILEKKPWLLETNVDQKELGFLEAGLPCWVVFDAYPGEKVKATISLVCSIIDFAKGTCNLKLRIGENRPFIKHGMTGSVEIAGRKVENVNVNVLALPAEYLLREPGGNFVLVKTGDKVEKRAVQFTAIGEKWLSIRNIPEGSRIELPK